MNKIQSTKMKKTVAAIIVFICFHYSSCIDYDYSNIKEFQRLTLPEYSESGRGTMACMIDGRIWTVFGKYRSYGYIGFGSYWQHNFPSVYINYDRQGDELRLHLHVSGWMTVVNDNVEIENKGLAFKVELAKEPVAEYRIGHDPSGYLSFNDLSARIRYFSDDSNPVTFKLNKFDKTDSIASGEFHGYLYNETDRSDSIRVEQGRFDVKAIIK
jgi:hypothetical protein